MAESEGPASGRPNRRRLVVRALLAVAVIAVVYLGVLPRLVDVSQVWATLRAMTWPPWSWPRSGTCSPTCCRSWPPCPG